MILVLTWLTAVKFQVPTAYWINTATIPFIPMDSLKCNLFRNQSPNKITLTSPYWANYHPVARNIFCHQAAVHCVLTVAETKKDLRSGSCWYWVDVLAYCHSSVMKLLEFNTSITKKKKKKRKHKNYSQYRQNKKSAAKNLTSRSTVMLSLL